MERNRKLRRRIGALALCATLLAVQPPAVAEAGNGEPGQNTGFATGKNEGLPMGSIVSFQAIDKKVAKQSVLAGTELSDLDLPDTVTAKVRRVVDDGGALEEVPTATPSKATKIATSIEDIPVTWDSEPSYAPDVIGTYVFTAGAKGYETADGAEWPRITVTVYEISFRTINDRFTVDGLSYKELGPDAVQVIGPEDANPTGTLTIPEKVTNPKNKKDYTVVSIGRAAFKNCVGYEGAPSLPYTLTAIGDEAFFGCSGFTGQLELPDTLTAIGKQAFYNCSGFTGGLELPDTLTTIEYGAFWGCSGFTGELKLPDTLTTIEGLAFAGSGFTGELKLPDTLTSIGAMAFDGCRRFTGELKLPDTIRTIKYATFRFCSGFTGEPKLPDTLTTIEESAFDNCSGFAGELKLPDTLTTIGESAFVGCSGFTGELKLPDALSKIENHAFWGCSGFTGELKLPNTLTSVGKYAFGACNFTSYRAANQAVARLIYDSKVDPSKITVNGQSVQIPSTEFYEGEMLYRITGQNTVALIDYTGQQAGNLIIPNEVAHNNQRYIVTEIGDYALDNLSGFTGELKLPDQLIEIGDFAFDHCSGFTGELKLPDTVTEIGENAFGYCSGFTGELKLPNTLTKIGNRAFYYCSGFTGGLKLPDTLTEIGNSAFDGCSGFAGELKLPGTLTRIASYTFVGCSGFTGELKLPDDLTEIGGNAFGDCSGFTGELKLPDTLTTIGDRAFAGCGGFTGKLNLPDTLIYIGDRAFRGCDGLTSARLGNYIDYLGVESFPAALPLSAGSPRVQLLVNQYLNQDAIADTSWDGGEDVPEGAIAAVLPDTTIRGDIRIGNEAEITVPANDTLTVNGSLTVDGALIIHGSIKGSGILWVGKTGKVTGNTSGVHVVYLRSSDTDEDDDGTFVNQDILKGTWIRTETGIWRFRQKDGSYVKNRWGMIDGLWYYFNGEGHMLTDWQYINGRWYYLCVEEAARGKAGMKEGAMMTGWYFDPLYQKWYYLTPDGSMAADCRIDGWYVDKSGAWDGLPAPDFSAAKPGV